MKTAKKIRRRSERCLSCQTKPARKGDYFCSDKCGAAWAYAYCSASEIGYCEYCGHAYFATTVPDRCDECGHASGAEERDTGREREYGVDY